MHPIDPHSALLLAHERTSQLRREAAAERLCRESRRRRGLTGSVRGFASRVPTPLTHRTA